MVKKRLKELISYSRTALRTTNGEWIIIRLEIYHYPNMLNKLPYTFSWIAYAENDPDKRVLFDCHPHFSPHYHIDIQPKQFFKWISWESTLQDFTQKVYERFGKLH